MDNNDSDKRARLSMVLNQLKLNISRWFNTYENLIFCITHLHEDYDFINALNNHLQNDYLLKIESLLIEKIPPASRVHANRYILRKDTTGRRGFINFLGD